MTNIGTATLFFAGDLAALIASMNKMKSQAASAGKETGGAFGAQFGMSLSNSLTNLIGVTSLGAAAAVLGRTTIEMAKLGDEVKRQRGYLSAWSGGVTQMTANINAMRQAVPKGVSELELMIAANKFLGMSIAKTSEELQEQAHQAVILGGSTRTAGQAMDEWASMIANKSIERMDTFQLSSSQARARINELTTSMQGLSNDEAFMIALHEQAAAKTKLLEDAGVNATSAIDDLNAAAADAKIAIAELVAPHVIPLVDDLANRIRTNLIPNLEYIFKIKPANDNYAAAFEQYAEAQSRVENAQKWLNTALKIGDTAMQSAAQAALDKATAERDSAAATYATAQAGAAGVTQNDKLAGSYDKVAKAAVGAAVASGAAALSYTPTSLSGSGFMSTNAYGEPEQLGIADIQRAYEDDRTARVQTWLDRWEAQNKTANTEILDTWRNTSSDIIGMFSGGQSASIGLSDLRGPGAGSLTAPGANGAFEDIYRLQAWIKDNSWGETAAKFGITDKADAAERIRKFQTGMWDESVTGLIDEDKLKQGVINEKQAEAYKKAFAQKIAAATGENMDVVSATIFGDASGNTSAQTQRMTTAGTDMAGGLIRGVVKAQPDLETEGYNAAMSYRAGWNRGMNEGTKPPNTGQPNTGVTGKLRETGSQE